MRKQFIQENIIFLKKMIKPFYCITDLEKDLNEITLLLDKKKQTLNKKHLEAFNADFIKIIKQKANSKQELKEIFTQLKDFLKSS